MSSQNQKKIKKQKLRRLRRVRGGQASRGEKLRVSVFRSLNHISAQVIDDSNHKTIVSCSTLQLTTLKGAKKEKAKAVGIELGKRALAQNVKEVYFDRGHYRYHGRVQALVEGLREAGLQV